LNTRRRGASPSRTAGRGNTRPRTRPGEQRRRFFSGGTMCPNCPPTRDRYGAQRLPASIRGFPPRIWPCGGYAGGLILDAAHYVLHPRVLLKTVYREVFTVPGVLEAAVGHFGDERDVGIDPYTTEVEVA